MSESIGPLFDLAERQAKMENAIARAEDHADPDWKAAAFSAVVTVAERHATFTSDEVWEVLDRMGVERPKTPAAIGPVMRSAAKEGLCVVTDSIRESRQISNHRKVTVWKSMRVAS